MPTVLWLRAIWCSQRPLAGGHHRRGESRRKALAAERRRFSSPEAKAERLARTEMAVLRQHLELRKALGRNCKLQQAKELRRRTAMWRWLMCKRGMKRMRRARRAKKVKKGTTMKIVRKASCRQHHKMRMMILPRPRRLVYSSPPRRLCQSLHLRL